MDISEDASLALWIAHTAINFRQHACDDVVPTSHLSFAHGGYPYDAFGLARLDAPADSEHESDSRGDSHGQGI